MIKILSLCKTGNMEKEDRHKRFVRLAEARTSKALEAIDFMATYGKEFGVSCYDLNGENRFKFGQLNAKKALTEAAIKKLVRLGYVGVVLDNGYNYTINDAGADFIEGMDDGFSEEYRKVVRSIFGKFDVSDQKTVENALKAAKRKGEV